MSSFALSQSEIIVSTIILLSILCFPIREWHALLSNRLVQGFDIHQFYSWIFFFLLNLRWIVDVTMSSRRGDTGQGRNSWQEDAGSGVQSGRARVCWDDQDA